MAAQYILNADDWGRDRATTERTLECHQSGALSSVSAMVFMEDSERAAAVAIEHGIDAGLHLNLTTAFTGQHPLSQNLQPHLERVANYLNGSRVAQTVFHPGLMRSFEYLAKAQRDEYCRLWGREAGRIDGHHHMHLSANVVLQGLLPSGVTIRRNFSFAKGEKGFWNRSYRALLDGWLSRSHPMTDAFYSLPPLEPDRLKRIMGFAQGSIIEIETHPINPDEHRFLTQGGLHSLVGPVRIASRYLVSMTASEVGLASRAS